MQIWSLWLINCFVWWWLWRKWVLNIHSVRTTRSLYTSASVRLTRRYSLVNCSLLLWLNSSWNFVWLYYFSVSMIFTINLLLNQAISASHLLSTVWSRWRGSLRSFFILGILKRLSINWSRSSGLAATNSVTLHVLRLHSILVQIRCGVLVIKGSLQIGSFLCIKFMRFDKLV
jgi:hypothetical protein